MAIAARQRQFLPAAHAHDVFAGEPRLHVADEIKIDDGRAVDAHELRGIDAALKRVHRLAQQIRIVGEMQPQVVPFRLDPFHLFEPNEYDHTLHIAEVLRSNPRTEEQWLSEIRSEREQQRLARLRNMKAQAERFITKYRGTT